MDIFFIKINEHESMELDLDKFIDFVIKDAFEGLSDTDPYSIEKSIRKWFKSYQLESSKKEDNFVNAFCFTEIHEIYEKFKTSPLRIENCIFDPNVNNDADRKE